MPDAPETHNPAPHENRLAGETSPYLLQHKDNPVAWWPWGPPALAEAKRSGRPILLSVGYAACHWCHVMAHESFENAEIAALMNDEFVNIKVDREERPDIDQIYMAALHHLGEQGGWPLTMFLDPDGAPIWGGTYFPPTSRYGRPGFPDVLRQLARLFREEPERIAQNRAALMQRLTEVKAAPGASIGSPQLDALAARILDAIDPLNGGLQGAPKFPQGALFELLWRAGLRGGGDAYFDAVTHSLERICQGGIYDHLGGGFSRYAVDERWLVPHFEKMLYDNAQLLDLLALAYGRTGNPLFRARAADTVAWLARELTLPGGGFASSLDADSEGQEGKFYVWSAAEVTALLGGQDAAFFARHYDVTPAGNFERENILNRLDAPPASAAEEARLALLRAKLLAARAGRVRPHLDDKVLADWNGLMIAALAHAGTAFGEPDWIAMAERAFAFVADAMARGERLGHSWRDGRLLFPGLASDFANMIRAALALHEATGAAAPLDQALRWQAALDAHHRNPQTAGYFLTADDAEGLVVRPASTADDAMPNHNALAAQNLVRLATLAGDDKWRSAADALFDGAIPLAAANLFGHAALLNALDLRIRAAEIVVTGSGEQSDALLTAARKLPFVATIVLSVQAAGALPATHPARAKIDATKGAAAFVCVGQSCSLPITEPAQLAGALAGLRPA